MKHLARTAAAVACLLLGVVVGAWWQGQPAQPREISMSLEPMEVGFAQDMSTHHLQAIELCHALESPRDPVVDALCAQITSSQNQEIGVLSGWLMLLDQPQTSSHPMAWMGTDHGHAGAHMPGMASWTEMDELRRRSGLAAETSFLQLMIRHHRGGLDMASYAAQHATTRAVAQLATSMIKEQSEEIGVMEPLLAARGGEQLAYP
ncbi:DUF305 domain-containing protein [Rhodococcus tibetensis]|uniref:DUF305 domain-containing protein n=1 Tax=Rhodococcus tibetensis TaxID=2965064 RepID=A0ABT1QHU4_9NOCA|nr:DUF305 domain-containing protein [Rhodococcus sp. FXJ9.536]MCQ4121350.1 DUF305 domain-containing protein [Rhodococcus sp. FXJ9.536]